MTRIHFHQQLARLKDKLLAMASLAQQALEHAVDAYTERDPALSHYVTDIENAINVAQREVDEMSYELLAQEQPMAIDLRFILAVIKINVSLERIGDQSMGIAERALQLTTLPAIEATADIEGMREVARDMIRGALRSLLEGDAQLAAEVIRMDDEADRMNREAHERLIALIMENAAVAEQALHLIIIARNLERIADHAANIARDVVFWVKGADIRHQPLPVFARE